MNNSFRNETVRTLVQSYTVAQFNEKYLADKEFRKFAKKVYSYFDNMRSGTCLRLSSYQGQKLEWLLLTYVAFYFESLHWLEFYISDDYTAVCRRNTTPEERDKDIRAYLKWKEQHG